MPLHYLEDALFAAITDQNAKNTQELVELIKASKRASLKATNATGDSFLIHAMRQQRTKIITLILDEVENTDIIFMRDSNQNTPLHIAIELRNDTICTRLLRLYDRNRNTLPIPRDRHNTRRSPHTKRNTLPKPYFMEANNQGKTALHAAANSKYDLVKQLLESLKKEPAAERIQHINQAADDGKTPLFLEVTANDPQANIIAEWLNNGANLNVIISAELNLLQKFLGLARPLQISIFKKLTASEQSKMLKLYREQLLFQQLNINYEELKSIYLTCAGGTNLKTLAIELLEYDPTTHMTPPRDKLLKNATAQALVPRYAQTHGLFASNQIEVGFPLFDYKLEDNKLLHKQIQTLEKFANLLQRMPKVPPEYKLIAILIPIALWLALLTVVAPLSISAVQSSNCGKAPPWPRDRHNSPAIASYDDCMSNYNKYAIPAGMIGGVVGFLLLMCNIIQCLVHASPECDCCIYPARKEAYFSPEDIESYLGDFHSGFIAMLTDLREWDNAKRAADENATSVLPLSADRLGDILNKAAKLQAGGKISRVITLTTELIDLLKQARISLSLADKPLAKLVEEMRAVRPEVVVELRDDEEEPLLWEPVRP